MTQHLTFSAASTFTVGATDVEVVAHEATQTKQTESSTLLATGKNLVTVITKLDVSETFLVVLPHALDTPSTLFLVAEVVAVGTLNTHSHVVPVAIAHGFKRKERLWVLDEGLGNTHLPFLASDSGVGKDTLTAATWITLPGVLASIRGVRRQEVESLDHLFECVTVGETGTSNTNVLLQTKILDLVENGLRIVLGGALVLVGLDGTNVRRLSTHEVLNKSIGARLDTVTGGGRTLLAVRIRTIREELLEVVVGT